MSDGEAISMAEERKLGHEAMERSIVMGALIEDRREELVAKTALRLRLEKELEALNAENDMMKGALKEADQVVQVIKKNRVAEDKSFEVVVDELWTDAIALHESVVQKLEPACGPIFRGNDGGEENE